MQVSTNNEKATDLLEVQSIVACLMLSSNSFLQLLSSWVTPYSSGTFDIEWSCSFVPHIGLYLHVILQVKFQCILKYCQVIVFPARKRAVPPANIPSCNIYPNLISQSALLKFEAPKLLSILHCKSKVGTIHRKQAIIPNVSGCPVLELNL